MHVTSYNCINLCTRFFSPNINLLTYIHHYSKHRFQECYFSSKTILRSSMRFWRRWMSCTVLTWASWFERWFAEHSTSGPPWKRWSSYPSCRSAFDSLTHHSTRRQNLVTKIVKVSEWLSDSISPRIFEIGQAIQFDYQILGWDLRPTCIDWLVVEERGWGWRKLQPQVLFWGFQCAKLKIDV